MEPGHVVAVDAESGRPDEEKPSGAAVAGRYYLGSSGFSVYEEMARHLKRRGWTRLAAHAAARCDVFLGDRFQIPYGQFRCEALPPSSCLHGHRWINYFNGSHKLTQKAAMTEILRAADSTSEQWLPQSFVLDADPAKRPDEREGFLAAAQATSSATWIVKPSSGCKGEEIVLVRGPAEVQELLSTRLAPHPGSKKRYAVQAYVEKPLLLSHGRKFDVRVWALLTSPYSIYAFTQGSCRTASVPFNLADLHNTQSHLTNHCLQEGSAAFGQFEAGNELWFTELQTYLEESMGMSAGVLEERVLPQMAQIIVRSLLSMKSQLQTLPDEPFSCFQLFGYDFIIDADLTVLLLEINGSPGVAERYLAPVVSSVLERIGCESESSSAATAPMNAAAALRRWSIHSEQFALLWAVGDAIPAGLRMD